MGTQPQSDAPPDLVGHHVRRPRLRVLLDAGGRRAVTSVSGPAGSGKTQLIAAWLRDRSLPARVTWVSGRDGAGAIANIVRSAGQAGVDPGWLIVDEADELDLDALRSMLSAVLRRGPPRPRLVLIGRRDPSPALHLVRLAGELTEVRAADLAFTREETGELLRACGLRLPDDAVAHLHERTQGWAAGLCLAASALAHQPDPAGAALEFSGSERMVSDYLDAEVLGGHPPDVREMVLRTCLLECVDGELVELLAARPDGERVLRELEAANALVVAVDVKRSAFRYHPLLRDALEAELRARAPETIREIHAVAGGWHAARGQPIEALGHARAAEDWTTARDLLMEHWVTFVVTGRQAALDEVVAALPRRLVAADPELAALTAVSHLLGGRPDDADAYLALASRLEPAVAASHRRQFAVGLTVFGLLRARARGDYAAAVQSARPILTPDGGETWADVARNEDLRALALMSLGSVELWALQLEPAEEHLREALALAEAIDRPYVAIGCLGPLAEVAALSGRLEVAEQLGRRAVDLADRHGWADDRVAGPALSTLAGVCALRGRLQDGERWLERAEAVLSGLPDPESSVVLPFRRGWLSIVRGDFRDALVRFREAEHACRRLRAPHFMAELTKTRLLRTQILLGDTAPARAALGGRSDGAPGAAEWCLVAAELHLADGHPEPAVATLSQVVNGAAPGFHPLFAMEAELLTAVALERDGDAPGARRALDRALDLAEPDGHVGVVLSVPAVRPLLERHTAQRTAHAGFARTVLDAFAGRTPAGAPSEHAPLSDRELSILRLLPTNLSAAEIAGELRISVHTVKTHMRHVYSKFSVHRRSDAVERGRALGLLAPPLHTN